MNSETLEDRLDNLRACFINSNERPEELDRVNKLIARYRDLTLKISIDDEKIIRLCQILTDMGCITIHSCEGHGKEIPMIWIMPPDNPEPLIRLCHILNAHCHNTHFPWHVIVEGNPNAGMPLTYLFQPSFKNGPINLPDDYKKLIVDMNTIAINILDYFDE